MSRLAMLWNLGTVQNIGTLPDNIVAWNPGTCCWVAQLGYYYSTGIEKETAMLVILFGFKTFWTSSRCSVVQVHYCLSAHCEMSRIKSYHREAWKPHRSISKGPTTAALLPYQQHGNHVSECFAREVSRLSVHFQTPKF